MTSKHALEGPLDEPGSDEQTESSDTREIPPAPDAAELIEPDEAMALLPAAPSVTRAEVPPSAATPARHMGPWPEALGDSRRIPRPRTPLWQRSLWCLGVPLSMAGAAWAGFQRPPDAWAPAAETSSAAVPWRGSREDRRRGEDAQDAAADEVRARATLPLVAGEGAPPTDAASSMARIHGLTRETPAALVAALDDADWARRLQAHEALRALGEAARATLEQGMHTGSLEQRWRCREILAELDGPR